MNGLLLGVLAYVAVQLAIGLAVSRRVRTESDYLVAGRSFGYGLATFSIFATWFGAETCIGAAGEVYERGLSGTSSDPFGYTACLLLMALVFAVPLWRRKLTTLADLFHARFSPAVERLAALIMIPTSVLWAAAQIRAFGHVLATTSDGSLDPSVAIGIAAAVVIAYTISGGMWADAVTDVVQGLALMVGLAVVLVAVASAQGGLAPALASVEPERWRLVEPGTSWLQTADTWARPILGSVVAQELFARTMASRSPQVARRSALAAAGIYLAFGLIPVFVGLVGPGLVPGLEHGEQILPAIAKAELHGVFYVLFAGALVSAILSTVDSALLVSGSLFSRNVLLARRPETSDRTRLLLARAGVAAFGLIAWALALSAESVHGLVQQASSFGSSGILVILVFGLFTRVGGAPSAAAALIASVASWCLCEYVLAWPLAFLASLAAALLAYLAFSAPWRWPSPVPQSHPDRGSPPA